MVKMLTARAFAVVFVTGLVASIGFAASNGGPRGTKKVTLAVDGDCFCCPECFLTFKESVMQVKGVKRVEPSLADRQTTVEYNPNVASLHQIISAAKQKGYTATPIERKVTVATAATGSS